MKKNLKHLKFSPQYRVSGPVSYGAPEHHFGNNYWINVPIGTSEERIKIILENEVKIKKHEEVVIGNRSFNITEITFYFYNELSSFTKKEKVAGQDLADLIFEWNPSTGLVKQ